MFSIGTPLVSLLLIKLNLHRNGMLVFRTIHLTLDLLRPPVSTLDTMRVTHRYHILMWCQLEARP